MAEHARLGLPLIALSAITVAHLAGCAPAETQRSDASSYAGTPGPWPGYLKQGVYPDSIALLPQPPEAESSAAEADLELNRKMLELQGTARWDLAASDARTRFPDAASTFSCAAGVPIGEDTTPSAYVIMRRTMVDAGMTVRPAKKHFNRDRPFTVNDRPVCTPTSLKILARDGSYPSGHATAGWAWALILAEIAPERGDEILARGRAFGQSRAVCNVHWQSDVDQGRVIASAIVARLHADPGFRADLEAAREEIAAARAQGLPPNRDCDAEAAALAITP